MELGDKNEPIPVAGSKEKLELLEKILRRPAAPMAVGAEGSSEHEHSASRFSSAHVEDVEPERMN